MPHTTIFRSAEFKFSRLCKAYFAALFSTGVSTLTTSVDMTFAEYFRFRMLGYDILSSTQKKKPYYR